MTAPRLRHLGLAVVVVVGGACGGSGDGPAGSGAPATTAATSGPTAGAGPSSTTAAAPVPEKLQFTAAGVDGREVTGAAYAGKDVVLWFWAPW